VLTLDKENNTDLDSLLALAVNFKKAFSIIRVFTTESVIIESPQTAMLGNKDRHKDQGHYFLLSAFLTDTRASCLPVLTGLLSLLNKFDNSTTQPLLSSLCDLILGGPEEFHTDASKYEGEPDEESVQRLAQLGFDRNQAISALMANGNVEGSALAQL